ncbi:MAG TPA: DUF2608 domain-containing protein [Elusimicrobiales bacterium]|nr:DUF2608 domain-containing protein [Elusimicrobiales bacterium]
MNHSIFKIIFPLLLAALPLLPASAAADKQLAAQSVVETETLAPVYAEAKRQLALGKQPLVIFDIDNTLSYHDFYLGNEPWFGSVYADYLDSLRKNAPARLAAEERAITWLTVMLMSDTPYFLTEQDLPRQIRELQQSGLKVMAQTSRCVLIAAHTVADLHRHGIDFSASSPFPDTYDFIPWEGARPVICSGGACFGQLQDKGKILLMLMAKHGYKPQAVILADDSKKNIAAMGAAMKEAGIPYSGFRYSKLDKMMERYHAPESLAAARVQLKDYLLNGRLMPNQKALELSRTAPVSVEQQLKMIFGPQAAPAR